MLRGFINYIKSAVYRRSSIYGQIFNLTGLWPNDQAVYRCALTHKSFSKTNAVDGSINNERLEFLGDAILDAIIADYLFGEYPQCDEGFLTKMRSRLVNRDNLNKIAVNMGIDELIMLNGKAILTKKHIYGNALEALIGAVYVDKGFAACKNFVIDRILKVYLDLDRLECEDVDFKSRIIQWGQKNKQEVSFESYEMFREDSPNPVFIATIRIMNMLAGEGLGATKKEAQQHAARQALQNLSA